ncbi:MAG: hypothetical protein K6E66_05910, partial [Lachnospiraceae bacterium]|nr:hypothetical protein [Lachnospiraceae bacterium]
IESPPVDPSSDAYADASEYEQITFLVCIGDPASYIVYVITPDEITEYNFTNYWMNASGGYDYFEEPMPDEGKYLMVQYDLSSEGWDKLVDAFTDNKFENLPEDMHADDVCDGPHYDIEVKTADETFISGGYAAGDGTGRKQERYHNVVTALHEVIHDAEEEAKEAWALFTEPQEPVYLNEPATADVFAAFDDHYEFNDLEYYFGPYDEVDEDSVPIRYGWELTDGGIAWVSFGAQSRVSDIELWYDDHFEILMSSLKCLETGFDVKYHDIDPGSLSEYDAKFFDLITMMIQNEIDAVSEDHLYSNNDYEVVAHFGEKLDRDEPEVLGEYAMWSSYRMPASDLAAFYEEVFHEEREFEPDFDRNFDINDLPEQGILCMDDGYCYTCAGAMYEQHTELVSVAESDGVYILNSRMISDLNGEVMGYVRYVLKTTDGTYGYELLDHMYSHVMY